MLALIDDYVRFLMASPRAMQFLGVVGYMRFRGIPNINIPWGWKDPRNTFTLPYWLRLFPDAKIVYIERHGVDVAQSLLTRSRKGLIETRTRYKKYKQVAWLRPKRGGFVASPRCASLEGGFSLWREYLAQAKSVLANLPTDRILRLRYEDLLSEPLPLLKQATAFCELTIEDSILESVCDSINAGRAFAYTSDAELQVFAERYSQELAEEGYRSST